MNSLLFISFLIIGIIITYSVFQFFRNLFFLRDIKKLDSTKKNVEKVMYIIIPCLREQNSIVETIDYFESIVRPNSKIIIVTTQKENSEYKKTVSNLENDLSKLNDNELLNKYEHIGINKKKLSSLRKAKDFDEILKNIKTTAKIVEEKILSKYDNVILVDYPKSNGYMANQLNYVIDNLKSISGCKVNDNNYIVVYNADSRPDKRTFKEFEKIEGNPKVIQQYSYSMKNYDDLNFLLKGFSIYQSNFELKTGLINSFYNTKFLYTHVVGHGLFLRYDFIKEINGFNTDFWCEDIYLTLYLKHNDINIVPLINLENMETANSLENLIKQNGVWFKTTSNFYGMLKHIQNKTNKVTLSGFIGAFNELRCAINWLSFPFTILFLIISALINRNLVLFILTICTYSIYIITYTISTINTINTITNKKYKINLEMFLATFCATLISNAGPLYALIYNPKIKHKTER